METTSTPVAWSCSIFIDTLFKRNPRNPTSCVGTNTDFVGWDDKPQLNKHIDCLNNVFLTGCITISHAKMTSSSEIGKKWVKAL